MNQFTIKIKELEDSLLARLSAAGGNFLGDYALVENLENTKRTAAEIEVKVAEGKTTEVKINEAREQYRPAAARSSLLYFILNDLNKINPIYQFSLKVSEKNKNDMCLGNGGLNPVFLRQRFSAKALLGNATYPDGDMPALRTACTFICEYRHS